MMEQQERAGERPAAAINRLILLLSDALSALGGQTEWPTLEAMAVMIHQTMDQPRRVYHTSRHVLEVAEGAAPVQVLAALFHDLVYLQLDGDFPVLFSPIGERLFLRSKESITYRPSAQASAWDCCCAELFGFAPGDCLTTANGLNEFASALLAAEYLAAYLEPQTLLAILACIEASIPFRGAEMPLVLEERLARAAIVRGLATGEAERRSIVQTALAFANRDVQSFASAEQAAFLSDTWSLIEESNLTLVWDGIYSVRDYRLALSRMAAFLEGLDARRIFHAAAGVPETLDLQGLIARAERNLAFALRFLHIKLLSFGVVEALVMCTGGDCPVSMVLGHVRQLPTPSRCVEDFLPAPGGQADLDPEMLDLFLRGRLSQTGRDLIPSPLAAYCYQALGEAESLRLFASAQAYFSAQVSAEAFLGQLPLAFLGSLIQACAAVSPSRQGPLRQLGERLRAG